MIEKLRSKAFPHHLEPSLLLVPLDDAEQIALRYAEQAVKEERERWEHCMSVLEKYAEDSEKKSKTSKHHESSQQYHWKAFYLETALKTIRTNYDFYPQYLKAIKEAKND